MARSRKGRGGKVNKKRNFNSKDKDKLHQKKERKHLMQYGEIHPADETAHDKTVYGKVRDEEDLPTASSSEDESISEVKPRLEKKSDREMFLSFLDPGRLKEIQAHKPEDDNDYIEGEDPEVSDDRAEEMEEDLEEEEEEDEKEEDDEEEEHMGKENDPFTKHFERVMTEEEELMLDDVTWKKTQVKLGALGVCSVWHNGSQCPKFQHNETNLERLYVKKRLCQQVAKTNVKIKRLGQQVAKTNVKIAKVELQENESLTTYQRSMFSVLNNYQDLYVSYRAGHSVDEMRVVYCMHALNHVLKTRSRIITHNAKLKDKKDKAEDDDNDNECRDQGFTRPKVLILAPFRSAALKTVSTMIELMSDDKEKATVTGKKRFFEEYGSNKTIKTSKPVDFQETFNGNTNDMFCLSMMVSKKSIKLYSDYASSDILVASPIKLSSIINDNETKGSADFLSSIEILVVDQSDVLSMQNWEHVKSVLRSLNQMPSSRGSMDIQRVRMWALNKRYRQFRQSIVLGSTGCPSVTMSVLKHCNNWAGRVIGLSTMHLGTVTQIKVNVHQTFLRLDYAADKDDSEERFKYFTQKVLPKLMAKDLKHTLIFIPCYYDVVRIRNYFKKQDMQCETLMEYSKDKYMTRARSAFYMGLKPFMIYTERLHFSRRFHLKGVKHIVFYQLPQYGHFYPELVNMIGDVAERKANEKYTTTVIYSKEDVMRLNNVLCTRMCQKMLLEGSKSVQTLVTE